jgi:RNA polymerase sigma-70 factor, ECF subfamily
MAFAAPRESRLAEDLFTAHSRRVYAFCLRRLGSPEEAEDALQATYLNACRSLMRGFEPDEAQAWLLAVAQNVCIDRIRTKSRRRLFERSQGLDAVEEIVAAPEHADEDLLGLDEALARLPEQQRQAILLREWKGLSYREVAIELGMTQSAVEALLFRARRSLARALESAVPRPRLVHAFHPASLFANLKAGLATGVAIAASATVLSAAPIVADSAPHLFPDPPLATTADVPKRVFQPPVATASVSTSAAGDLRAKKAKGLKRHGPPPWARGNAHAKGKDARPAAPPAKGRPARAAAPAKAPKKR